MAVTGALTVAAGTEPLALLPAPVAADAVGAVERQRVGQRRGQRAGRQLADVAEPGDDRAGMDRQVVRPPPR